MTSLQSIRNQTPCLDSWKRLLHSLGKTKSDITPFPHKQFWQMYCPW